MVIADLDKSGWSVFSWAVIADLSFESLRFARWVFSHLSPLCSRLWSGQSHQATFICSSHLFTKNTKKAILFFCWQNIDKSVWIRCHVSLINDYWFCIAEGTTTCPCDEFGREDITNHCRILRVIAVELLNCYFHVFGDYWFNTRKGGHMSVWRMRTWDRDITGHYRTSVVMAVTTGK